MSKKGIIIVATCLIALLCGGFFYMFKEQERKATEEKKVLVKLQKEAIQEELANLSDEYESQYNKLTINGREMPKGMTGDSLLTQLSRERAKVNNLLEELSKVKSSNAKEIAQLSKQVSTLRRVLKTYVVQIDSLHRTNQRLIAENQTVKKQYEKATQEVKELADEKENLKNIVNLASKLDLTNLSVTALNKRNRPTSRISKMKKLRIAFRITKNITANVGMKNFYVRIMSPRDELLEGTNKGTFLFEEKQIPYSIQRSIEYDGEETDLELFWHIDESLEKGTYRLQVFENGSLIGKTSFEL